jgi:RNA 2',3'-cyclic 3'-phosphodiesterase
VGQPETGHTGAMTRLFVTVWPPDELIARLAAADRPRDQGVNWTPQENLHVTLRFLGEADPDEVIARLDGATLPAATAVVGPAIDVMRERALVLPVAGVDELAAEVHRSLRGIGTEPERRRFVGHITVARLARGARPERSIGRRFDATFTVEEVALVESTLTPDGAVYETIATWPVSR